MPGFRSCIALLLAALACSSCGKVSRRACYPVQGKVFYRGKPAAGATVFLHPAQAPDAQEEWYEPAGVVEADGSFRLTTYETEEGAPAGEYSVTILSANGGSRNDEILPGALPQIYESPVTSGLQVRIAERSTQLDPFQLTETGARPSAGREGRGGR
jgi:hypothetical protein